MEVKLGHATCLTCGGELTDHTIKVQYQGEIPPVRPIVPQFNVETTRCGQCRQRFQARHPEQTLDALGAAAVQIGPCALGLTAEVKHGLGVPSRIGSSAMPNAASGYRTRNPAYATGQRLGSLFCW